MAFVLHIMPRRRGWEHLVERLDEGAAHGVDADPQDLSQDGDFGAFC